MRAKKVIKQKDQLNECIFFGRFPPSVSFTLVSNRLMGEVKVVTECRLTLGRG